MEEQEASRDQGRRPVQRRILVVEDDENIRPVLEDILGDAGYRVRLEEDGAAGLRAVEEEVYDVILLDINLPHVDGIQILGAGRSIQSDAQFVMMSAYGSVDQAVEAMKLGAFDYLRKPFSADELLLVVDRALHESELRKEVAQLRRKTETAKDHGLIGKSPAMQRVFDLIERVAPTRANVLVLGETGTGKELVARAVHRFSDRARRPFVPVNCSALPETLLESELFGHMKGSFTGAIQTKRGLFEEAAGGTLFLDEISTVTPNIQVKLLRVLQERTIKRIGGTEQLPVDFRLVAASNRDLEELADEGEFREDLLYRLNVFPIQVPPLRERPTDIPLLANHFRLRYAEENGVEPPAISPETMGRMMAYDWPGNVRELENFIERSVIMHAGERSIPFEGGRRHTRERAEESVLTKAREETWDLDRLEREYILSVLERTHWHQGAAADVLGVNRRTLYRKLKRYREEGILTPEPVG